MKDAAGNTYRRAVGCEACSQRGYAGRLGVFSIAGNNDQVRKAIMTKDGDAIVDAARSAGWRSLREIGIKKLARGETSTEEVLKFT